MKHFPAITAITTLLLVVMTALGQNPATMPVNTWLAIPTRPCARYRLRQLSTRTFKAIPASRV
jgi:hypothetical protein